MLEFRIYLPLRMRKGLELKQDGCKLGLGFYLRVQAMNAKDYFRPAKTPTTDINQFAHRCELQQKYLSETRVPTLALLERLEASYCDAPDLRPSASR